MNYYLNDSRPDAAESDVFARLRHAEAENEQLNRRLLELGQALEDANNEISRLCMVLKHRERHEQYGGHFRNSLALGLPPGQGH